MLDLDGRYLLPGLWDEHVHFTQHALTSRRLDVSAATSAAEAIRMVQAALAVRPTATPGAVAPIEPLIGYGFRDGLWSDQPSVALLDAAAGAVPVVLLSGDLHCVWLNSAASALFTAPTDSTGLLREDAAFAVSAQLERVPQELLDAWVVAAQRAAAARGVVGVVDLEMAENRDVWLRRIAAGADRLRVDFGIYTQHLPRAIAEGLRSGAIIPGSQGLLTVGFFKVLIDGSLNTRTAYCFDEFPGLEGQPHGRGLLTVQPEDLDDLLRTVVAAGITPTVHAIGDQANRIALDSFERVGATGRIEHAQLVAADDLPRFGQLGLIASVQPEHAMDDRDIADHHWRGRTGRAFALRSLLDGGATLALGSDAPVAPLDPWGTMAAAVGRSRDGREPWHPEQSITVPEALAASTRGRTEVAAGDLADLAICDLDPLACSLAELRTMPVALTLLGGRVTHSSL